MSHLPLLLLLGRPGAGKSEVIRYLRGQSVSDRIERFGIGEFLEIDDFPMLWTWFEEDHILSEMGYPRLHSDADGYFLHHDLWNLLIRRLELDYNKLHADNPQVDQTHTVIVEFSRGREHGGFASAFEQLTDSFLKKAAVLYIDVSWEESLRKNRRRFNPDRPHSILEHGMDDAKLDRLYRESDWAELTALDPGYLNIRGVSVPYVALPNEDDVTTPGGEPLGDRLADSLGTLQQLAESRP